MKLKVGETGEITATIEPDNATNKKVNWSTSNENVATVAANGTVATVTAVAEGAATIIAKSEDGGFEATCEVTVEAAPEVKGSIERDPANTGGELVVTIEDDTVTFTSGEIKWYPEDEALGRAAGNRVGVQINAPADFDTSEVKVTIGETTYEWDNIEDGDGYFWWYPLVTAAGQEFTATVVWNESSTQEFKVVIGAEVTLEKAPDTTAPEFKGISPAEENVELAHDANFVLTVTASDDNLYELEVDHNIADLPEFSVYASEADPYGGQEAAFEEAGVTVTYDAEAQKWTIDFGSNVTSHIVNNGGITFYLVLVDEAGNKWGSMDPTTPENTFAYTVTQQAPEVKGSIARDPGNTGGKDLTVTVDGETITFDGNIEWYPVDESVGRNEAGNRVGVEITAPEGFDASGAVVTIGDDTYENLFTAEKNYFWWYPLVTQAGQQFTATVVWNESSTQEFKVVIGEGVTLEAAPDTTDPELKSVSPKAGDVNLEYGETFKLEVTASDKNLYELEVDHSFDGTLPEFSVYARADDPYGGQGEAFEQAGVTVTYNTEEQKWTIDFGEEVTSQIVEKGGITFYLVIKDQAGNQWGSMDPTTPENTFAYNVTRKAYVPMEVTAEVEPFTVGVQQEFIVKTVANDDAGRMVRAYFDIPAGVAVEYQEQNPDHPDYGKWFPLEGVFGPSTGFPVMNVDDSRFRATFDTAGDYSITIEFKEVGTDEVLATYVMNVTAVVETIAAEVDYTAVWNGDRGTWYIKVTVPGEDLDNGSVESIKAIKEAGAELSEPRELTPDTDKVMWFGVAKADGELTLKEAGEYAYEVVRKDGTKYIFSFTYTPGNVQGVGEVDTKAPELVEVSPDAGDIHLAYDETFKLEVTASDKNLYELEVDHSFDGTLPEFSVYARADDPYGGQGEAFEQAGVTVTYNTEEQKWTIDFGEEVTSQIVEKGGITFYLVIKDQAGNQWGSMDPTTPENTFAYNVTRKAYVPMEVTAEVEPFTVGVQQEFIVKTVANDDAGRMVRAYFDIPAGVAVEYQEQNPDHPDYGKWFPLEGVFGPSTGFPVMNVDDSRFRATFDTAGDYSITIEFKEVGTDEVLATYVMNVTAVVETIAAEVDYTAVWNGDRGTWYIKVTVPGEDLDNGSVESIKAIKEAGAELSEPRELTPDTDKVMWFGVAKADGELTLKEAGEYAYEVVRKDGTKYIFSFTYTPGNVQGVGEVDTKAPELVEVSPDAGDIHLAYDETFKLEVTASDKNLYELEVDHSFDGTLPEFSVYARADDPYGGQGEAFEQAGVTVTYNTEEQKWTIDFGEEVTSQIVEKGGITFYLVLVDEAGNKWGSMYEVTEENTFVYIVTQDEAPVAQIGETKYRTLKEAVEAVGENETITLLGNASGDGIKVPSGKKFTLDLGGFTYEVDGETVGSPGTENNGFQLLKGSDITIKNGKITTDKAKILIQKYCNLTLENVTLIGGEVTQYVLSNNNGTTTLNGSTTITAQGDNVAFDVYYWPKNGYESVTVEIGDEDVEIYGRIEYDHDGTDPEGFKENAKLIIPSGYELKAPEGYEWADYEAGKQILKAITYPRDITVTSANDSGIVDSEAYKGVTATFTLGGADLEKVESIKVELFDAEDKLLATTTLKSHKFPVSAGNLTAPIVAIEGTYAYGSWEKTVWTEGNPNPLTSPSYVVMTLTDDNGLTYSAEERDLHTVYSGGKTWSQLWPSSDASISGITVDGVAATVDTGDETVYHVELPYGTDLGGLTALDIVVTPTNAKAKVAAATTADGGATWTVVVTAEDGVATETYTIHVTVAEPTPRDITVQSSNQTNIVDAYYKGLNSTFSFGGNDLLDKTVTIKAELYGSNNELLATSVYKDVNSLLNAWKNQQPTGKFLAAAFVVSGDVEEKWETTWTDGNPSKDNVPAKVVMTVIDDIGQTHTAEESNITSMPTGTTWEDLFPSDWGELADTSWYDDSQTSFTISTAAELAGLAELVNSGTNFSGKTINLGADIDLLNLEWIPIGTMENPFRGKFNGADMEISNLKIDAPEAINVGLFGYVTGGSLSCLRLKDVNISAKEAVGALVGNVRGLSEPISNIEGSFIDILSTHWAGGLIGYSYASVKDCSVDEANVTLTYDTSKNDNGDKAGGITGYQGEGNFCYENCRTSNVEIVGVRDVGGLVGASQYDVLYINCHVEFSVITADNSSFEHDQPYAGGLIGRAAGSITLFDCSATPGGIIDDVFVPGVIVSSYKDGFAGELVGGPVSNVTIAKVLNSTQKKAYETIQVAIDGAEADNTILVSAGTFDEDITIKRSIKLFGANAGINPNNTDWSLAERRPETVFTGFIKAEAGVENIEIDGFKFTKGANGEGGALNFTLGGHTTIKIYNCIAEDTYANAEHRGSGFMYVTNHGPGGPRNGTVEFINNRLIDTHGSNTAGTSGVLIWSTNNVIANGNYFSRTDEETGMTSNAALNLLGQFGTVEIKNNYFDDMIIKLDGTSFDADAIIGNVFTGREGKSNILEFTTIRTPEEIEFLAENNTYSPEGLGYVAMEPVRLGDKGYTTIQAAVSAATVGDNTIKVYPGDYGTESIDIVQKEGVNITIEAVGEVTLKNQIRIDGAARANGAETLTIKGFTFDFSTANHSIITTTFLEEVEGRSTNLVYAHNVSIENCEFIGSPEVDVVAVAAGAPGGHRNFVIKNCTGTNLHSLGQLRVQGVTVENCNVSASEGGLNLQNSTDIKITNLTVSAPMDVDSYGVRTGQDSGTVNENNTMLISNSNLIAKYPIWLRGDAPGKVIVINSELTMDDIWNVANGQVTVIIDPPVYNKDIDAYYMTLQDAIKAASSGNIINIFGDCSIIGTSFVDKNLTFVGNSSKPKIEFPQGKDQPNYQTYYGCEFTFENLTLQCEPDKNYQGIQPDKVIARNCVINGKFWGYAKDLEFTDCVFNQNSSYNVWTYGSNVTFENCEFNSAGRSVLIYNEGATLEVPAKIVFKNCTFSASTTVDMKAAIDIDTRFASFIVEIENCSANGFSNVTEPGGITIIPGFIHLKGTDNGSLTVTVDGVQVYSLVPVTEVSLDKAEIILVADETETLIATVAPANATNKEVTWSSSDETVATVDENGKVTAVAAGKATITATSAADSSRKATCTVTVRAVSDIADVITGDFSVMTISDVIGYNVGFILSDAIALDVKEVVVKLYKGDTVLATNISTGLMEQYPNETSLSAPFDVSGSFDYEEDGCWDYSGWEGDNADIPTKAEIIVKFKNGEVETAINENLTGDTDIFSKIDAAISALNQHIGSVVNTNKLMEALQHEDLGLDAVVDEYLMNYAQALQEKYAEDNSFQFETIAEIQAFIDEVNSGVEELIRTVNEANNANELYKALSSEKLFSWYDFWDSESGRGVVRSNREVYFAELQVLRQENSELTTKAQIKSFVDAANLTPVGQVNLASLVTSFRSALTNPELGLNLEAYNNLNGVVRNTVSDTMFNRVKDDDISFVNAEQIQELLDEIINEAITEEFDIITLDNAMAEAAKGAAETKQDVEDAVAELEVAVSAFNDAKQETINEEEIEESGQGEEPEDEEEPEELDISPIDAAIEAAKVAKEGITVSEDGTDVPAGTYWVAQADMDTLDEAIAAAEADKETAETQQDVAEAVEALEAAVSTFNDAKQEVIDEEEIGAPEEGEEPVQGEEPADDEESVEGEEPEEDEKSVEDEEAVEGEEQEE